MWQLSFPAGEPIRWGTDCLRCSHEATETLWMEASAGVELPFVLGTLRKHARVDAPVCARCARWYERVKKPAGVLAGLATVGAVITVAAWLPRQSELYFWYILAVLGSVGLFWGTLARASFDLVFCRTAILLSPLDDRRVVVTFSPRIRNRLRAQLTARSTLDGHADRRTNVRIEGFGRSLRPKPPFEAWLEDDGRSLCILRRMPQRTLGFRLQVVNGVDDIRTIAVPSMVADVADLESSDHVGPWRVVDDEERTAEWRRGWSVRTVAVAPDQAVDHEWVERDEEDAPRGGTAARLDIDA